LTVAAAEAAIGLAILVAYYRNRGSIWINRNRRLARDFETTIDSARAFLCAASVMLLLRRVAREIV
jgi:hypothetical protein